MATDHNNPQSPEKANSTPSGERPADYTGNDQSRQQGANTGDWEDQRTDEEAHGRDGSSGNENDNTGGAGSAGSAATNS